MDALQNNGSGSKNTASGFQALNSNTTGIDETATGVQALQINTTGPFNTADGFRALAANTTGTLDTAAGVNALMNADSSFATVRLISKLESNRLEEHDTPAAKSRMSAPDGQTSQPYGSNVNLFEPGAATRYRVYPKNIGQRAHFMRGR